MAELNGKPISELPSINSLADADMFPVSANGASKKISWVALKTLIQALVSAAKQHKEVDYVDEVYARADFTLRSGGYYRIEPPSGALPSRAKVLSVAAIEWTSSNGISIIPYGAAGTEAYVIGQGGDTISGLRCRWWYAV